MVHGLPHNFGVAPSPYDEPSHADQPKREQYKHESSFNKAGYQQGGHYAG